MARTSTASLGVRWAALRLAADASPYYRNLSDIADGEPAEAGWRAIPFTTSSDVLESRAALRSSFRPLTTYASSGTTQKAKLAYFTPADHLATVRRTVVSLVACGARPTDTIVVAHGFGIWLIGSDFAAAGEQLGLDVLPVGKGPGLRHTLDLIEAAGADIVATSPAFAHRLASAVGNPAGEPVFGTRLLVLSGEVVTRAMSRQLSGLWGVEAVHSFYGSAELGHLGCDPDADGAIDISPDFCAEILDDAGTPLELRAGQRGEFALTTLYQQGMPLVRYRTGDQVELVSVAEAGEHLRISLRVLGRIEESVALEAGEKLWAWQLERALLEDEAVAEFQAVVEDGPSLGQWLPSHDLVTIRVTTVDDLPLDRDRLQRMREVLQSLSLDISAVAGATVDFDLAWVPAATLRDPQAEGKLRRLEDRRPHAPAAADG
jgi:phenylacetate-CoA ligase